MALTMIPGTRRSIRFIARRYTVESIDLKYENKRALRERFWLRDGFKPIVAYIGRLDGQKGVHLVRHALFYSLWNGGPVRAARTKPGSFDQRLFLASQALSERQSRIATWNLASMPIWLTWSMPEPTCW